MAQWLGRAGDRWVGGGGRGGGAPHVLGWAGDTAETHPPRLGMYTCTINNTSAENTELHENLVTGPVRGLHVPVLLCIVSPRPAPGSSNGRGSFCPPRPSCPLTLPQHRGQPSGFFHLKIFNNPLACKLISDPQPGPQSAGKLGPIIAIVCPRPVTALSFKSLWSVRCFYKSLEPVATTKSPRLVLSQFKNWQRSLFQMIWNLRENSLLR